MDREKVIKGLECCTSQYTRCDICPYWVHPGVPYCTEMKRDALQLLKEQQERIETLESLRRIEQEGR